MTSRCTAATSPPIPTSCSTGSPTASTSAAGLRDDSFVVMDALRELGEEVWFNLGDRDLAVCLQRARRLGEGARMTETLAELAQALGVAARVLPPTDTAIRTHVRARGDWFGFQEFMIGEGAD